MSDSAAETGASEAAAAAGPGTPATTGEATSVATRPAGAESNLAGSGEAATGGDISSSASPPASALATAPPDADTYNNVTPAADWPADWRQRLAGDDARFLRKLERYGSPLDFSKAHRALEQKLGSGETKRELPANPTADELAAWRAEQGIPQTEQGYLDQLDLPDGMVLGEADLPVAQSFARAALAHNWAPRQFNEAVRWYYRHVDALRAEVEAADDSFHHASERALRAEWGPHYHRYLNGIGNVLATLPDGMHLEHNGRRETGGMLLAARLPNGRLLGDDLAFVKWLSGQAQALNPSATIVPAGGGEAGRGLEARLKEISELRRNDPEQYAANRAVLEQEEIQLLDVQARLKKRGGA